MININYFDLMIAGTPTAIALSGTLVMTTAFAPI